MTEFQSQQEVQVSEKKRVIVDVGCGAFPFPKGVGQRKMEAGEIYIGIEPDLYTARTALVEVAEIGWGSGAIVRGVGEALPLASEVVDEVVLGNIIGSPRIVPTWYGNALLFNLMAAFASEISRVLKPGGVLRVVETNTPYLSPKGVVDLFGRVGLTLVRKLDFSEDQCVKSEFTKYVNESLVSRGSYLIEFERGQ